jgi:hypothetical protein
LYSFSCATGSSSISSISPSKENNLSSGTSISVPSSAKSFCVISGLLIEHKSADNLSLSETGI